MSRREIHQIFKKLDLSMSTAEIHAIFKSLENLRSKEDNTDEETEDKNNECFQSNVDTVVVSEPGKQDNDPFVERTDTLEKDIKEKYTENKDNCFIEQRYITVNPSDTQKTKSKNGIYRSRRDELYKLEKTKDDSEQKPTWV